MTQVVVDLLPRDAELARRAAGGDGAAFVRLYDLYSEEIFEDSLAASRSVETAAKATQTAFLRILRRPPALDAPDSEVAARLRRLVPGGPIDPAPAHNGHPGSRAADVGWLRSETVAMAGARFDDDWSTHLWTPEAELEPVAEEEPPDPPPAPAPSRRPLARPRLRLPSPVAVALLGTLAVLGGLLGTFLTGASDENPADLAPEAAVHATPAQAQPAQQEPAKRRDKRAGEAGQDAKRQLRDAAPTATPESPARTGGIAPTGALRRPRLLAMRPPPEAVTEEEPAPAPDSPESDTPPGAEQDGSAGDRRNCHSKKATEPC